MRAVVEAEFPNAVARDIAAAQRERPGEDEAAEDDACFCEGAFLAISLVDVHRMGVAKERRELHVLSLAHRATSFVGVDVADREIVPIRGESADGERLREIGRKLFGCASLVCRFVGRGRFDALCFGRSFCEFSSANEDLSFEGANDQVVLVSHFGPYVHDAFVACGDVAHADHA